MRALVWVSRIFRMLLESGLLVVKMSFKLGHSIVNVIVYTVRFYFIDIRFVKTMARLSPLSFHYIILNFDCVANPEYKND